MATRGWAWPTPQWRGLDLAGRTLGLIGSGASDGAWRGWPQAFACASSVTVRIRPKKFATRRVERCGQPQRSARGKRCRLYSCGAQRRDTASHRRARTVLDEAIAFLINAWRAARSWTRRRWSRRCRQAHCRRRARRVQPGAGHNRPSDEFAYAMDNVILFRISPSTPKRRCAG